MAENPLGSSDKGKDLSAMRFMRSCGNLKELCLLIASIAGLFQEHFPAQLEGPKTLKIPWFGNIGTNKCGARGKKVHISAMVESVRYAR